MSESSSFDPRVVVRPRTLDESVDLALAYVRVGVRDFWPLFAVLTLTSLAVIGLLVFALDLAEPGQVIAALLIGPIVERAVTAYGGRHLFGHAIAIKSALGQAIRQAPVAAVSTTMVHLPWILMIIGSDLEEPGLLGFAVVTALLWPFVVASHIYLREVLVLEHLGFSASVRRARLLTQYRYERALGLLAFSLLVRVVVALLAYSWIRFVAEFLLQFASIPDAIVTWFTISGWLVAGQFLALARLFDYVDARTRREGWDIQIRFDAIKQKDDAARVPADGGVMGGRIAHASSTWLGLAMVVLTAANACRGRAIAESRRVDDRRGR